MVEAEREHGVAGLEEAEVDGHVRLGARMRLDVRVVGAEERLRPVDRELLELVDDLAAAVVAAAGIALRVLVRRDRADGLEDRRPREVLGRDQLDLARAGARARARGARRRPGRAPRARRSAGARAGRLPLPRGGMLTSRGRPGLSGQTASAESPTSRRRSRRPRSKPGPPRTMSAAPSRASTKSFPSPPSTRSWPAPGTR